MATWRRPRGDELTYSIIGAFYAVYNGLGYGLLESVYAAALQYELECRGHSVDREVWLDVFNRSVPVARQRIDMLVWASSFTSGRTPSSIAWSRPRRGWGRFATMYSGSRGSAIVLFCPGW